MDASLHGCFAGFFVACCVLALMLPASPAEAAEYAYVANSADGTVSVIDLATETVVKTVAVGIGPVWSEVTYGGDHVVVCNYGASTVSVIDTATNSVVETVDVVDQPGTAAADPQWNLVYIGQFDKIRVLSPDHKQVLASIDPDLDNVISSIAVTPDGRRLYVGSTTVFPGQIQAIDVVFNPVTEVFGYVLGDVIETRNSPEWVVMSPEGSYVYVGSQSSPYGIDVVDTTTNTVVDEIVLPGGGTFIAADPVRSRLYATVGDSLVIADTSTNTVTTSLTLGGSNVGVAVTADGSKVYVTDWTNNRVTVVDGDTLAHDTTVSVGDGPHSRGRFIQPGELLRLFVNGFESGDTTGWSAAVP